MFIISLKTRVHFIVCSFLVLLLAACGGGNLDDPPEKTEQDLDNQGDYKGKVLIQSVGEPVIDYDAIGGFTNVGLDFVVRTESELPLSEKQVDIKIKINDQDIDVEATLNSSSKELKYSLHYSLVLDTSYSMQVSNSFDQMLNEASKSVQTGIDIWNQKPGTFTFQTTWFHDYIYHADNSTPGTWSSSDIKSIPRPYEGSQTRLFGAIDYSLDKLIEAQKNRPVGDDKLYDILVIFSDGKDNYSNFDNRNHPELLSDTTLVTSTGAPYEMLGSSVTTADNIIEKIKSIDGLTVHVIGLGDKVDDVSLQNIAQSSQNGRYFPYKSKGKEIAKLFDQVTQEFTTIQTKGVKFSLDSGKHKFSLLVNSKASTEVTEHTFYFQVDVEDETARIITEAESD